MGDGGLMDSWMERQWLKENGQENRSNVNENEAQSQCEVIISEIISDVKLT